ncbi:hypothetical protein ACKFKG_23020 [Phormidesmis sp. 146-35]
MSVYSNEIDLEVLKYALEHYAASLPDDESQALLDALKAWKNQEPDSARHLCELVSQSAAIDQIYTQALKAQRQPYTAQERAKSFILTADSFSDRSGLSHLADQLFHILDRHQQQEFATQASEAEWEILKALETHPLRTKDLTYSIGLPLAVTRTVVQALWQKGYVELLSAPLAYCVFPGLRRASDRQKRLAEDEFLSLTSTGYLRLHPLIQVANRGK